MYIYIYITYIYIYIYIYVGGSRYSNHNKDTNHNNVNATDFHLNVEITKHNKFMLSSLVVLSQKRNGGAPVTDWFPRAQQGTQAEARRRTSRECLTTIMI